MSRTTSFLISLFIYVSFTSLFFILFETKNSISYGNSSINLLLVDDLVGGGEIDSSGTATDNDFTKEPNRSIVSNDEQALDQDKNNKEPLMGQNNISNNEVKIEDMSRLQEEYEKINEAREDMHKDYSEVLEATSSINDLFANISIPKIASTSMKNPKKMEIKPVTSQESISKISASRKATSSGEGSGAAAQVAGLYDKYFGRINAYLKNIWSLILSSFSGIKETDEQIINFTISPLGVLSIDSFKTNNLPINQAARIFADKINQEARNFGPPPGSKLFKAKARLGIKFSIGIK